MKAPFMGRWGVLWESAGRPAASMSLFSDILSLISVLPGPHSLLDRQKQSDLSEPNCDVNQQRIHFLLP